MEHGLNPIGPRAEIERYIKKVITKDFDQTKIMQIF